MMRERGKITEISAERTVIEIFPKEKCGKCCGCSASKVRSIAVPGDLRELYSEGEEVEVEVEPGKMLRVFTLLYGVPLAVFITVMAGVYFMTGSPLLSFGAGLFMTICGYLAVGRVIRGDSSLSARIVRKTGPEGL